MQLEELLATWDGHFASAEKVLLQAQAIFEQLEKITLTAEALPKLQILLTEYQKITQLIQQEKVRLQREASKLNQTNQKVRNYVQFNQSAGYEFYY